MSSTARKMLAGILAAGMITAFMPAVVFADTAADETTPGTSTTEPAQSEQNGWVEQDGSRYYYQDGKALTGLQTIEDAQYYFSKSGKMQTGWIAEGSKAWYFDPSTGQMAKNTKIKYLKIPASGNLGKAYAMGIKQLNKSGWTLRKAFNYSAKLKYANRSMRKKTSEDYAIVGFKTGKGNCYVMAGTFYVQAKLLGYDVHQISGKVDRAHSWTEIKQGGKTYVYDPNFTNETKRNGYKIRYKQHGTWRYHIQKRMN
ncbi:MAG: hypothetical protein ACI4W2_06985 [Eubacterium sp.]